MAASPSTASRSARRARPASPRPSTAWSTSRSPGVPRLEPVRRTVTVTAGDVIIGVTNPIVRVTAPVRLVKSFDGPQGVVDPARTYPISWSCSYAGSEVDGGTVDVGRRPGGRAGRRRRAADHAVCTATEGDLGPPSPDPAFRWEPPDITDTTVTGARAEHHHSWRTRSPATTAPSGSQGRDRRHRGLPRLAPDEDFTLHGQCSRDRRSRRSRRRTADGPSPTAARDIVASVGWTCSGLRGHPRPGTS